MKNKRGLLSFKGTGKEFKLFLEGLKKDLQEESLNFKGGHAHA